MYELKVENMSCGHCVNAVTKAVQAVDPAAQVQVDLAGKKVSVESGAQLAQIRSAIEEAGYPVGGKN
jgi:copper chaperone